MIDNAPNFNRDLAELEAFFVFCCCVPGKKAELTINTLEGFLEPCADTITPFEYIMILQDEYRLEEELKRHKVGQYNRIYRCLSHAASSGIDLETCTVEDLEAIPGIGPKTARFFVMFSRPNQRYAALDTHILAFLRDRGHQAPRQTPQNAARYKDLEQAFLSICDRENVDPTTFDYEIWKKGRAKK